MLITVRLFCVNCGIFYGAKINVDGNYLRHIIGTRYRYVEVGTVIVKYDTVKRLVASSRYADVLIQYKYSRKEAGG